MAGRTRAFVEHDVVAAIFRQLRERRPVVLGIGNVRADHVNRAVRAIGASLMFGARRDVESGIARADAVVLWPVLTDAAGRRHMEHVLAAARMRGTPVVIDAGIMKSRRLVRPVQRMIRTALWPVVSATGEEIAVLAGSQNLNPSRLARTLLTSGGIAAVRGNQSVVTDGRRVLRVEPWNEWLQAVDASAPAAAIIAAFLSVAHLSDFITVTAVALGCLGYAADRASRRRTKGAMRLAVFKELADLSTAPRVSDIRITERFRRAAKR